MAKQLKEVSKYATSYKRRSGGVDKRTLRGLNRTIEQKEKRNENVNRRRTLYSTDDSLRDIEEDIEAETETTTSNARSTTDSKREKLKSKAENRKEMLDRWRKEKELKKKLETQKQKKPGFKVFHVPDTAAELKITQKLAPVKHVTAAPKVFSKPAPKPVKTEPPKRVTRSSTRSASTTSEKTKPATKQKERSNISGGASKTVVAQKHSTFVPTKKSTTAPTSKRAKDPVRATRSTTSNVATGAKTGASEKSRATSVRRTRSSVSHSTTTSSKDKGIRSTAAKKTAKNNKSSPELVLDLENTPHVTRSRGEAEAIDHDASLSFPASKFQFKAPDNITPYEFTPLSPGSAAGFLFPSANSSAFQFSFSRSPSLKSRRCSTPKVVDLMKKKPVINSPAASIIKEVDSTDSEPENDNKRRKSKVDDCSAEAPRIQVEPPSDTTISTEETTRNNQSRSTEQNTKTETALGVSDVDSMFVTAAEAPDNSKMEVDEPAPTRRRSTRRSISSSGSGSENEQRKSTPGRRRSTRRSVAPAVESVTEEKEQVEPTIKSRMNSRKSVNSESFNGEETKTITSSSRRRSTRRSMSSTEDSDLSSAETQPESSVRGSSAATEKTPSKKRRRSTRKSLAIAGTPRLSDIPEPISEVESEEKAQNEAGDTEDKNNSNSQMNSSVESLSRKKNVVIVDDSSVPNTSENGSTPTIQPKPLCDDAIFRTPASLPSNRKALSARRKTTALATVAAEFSTGASKQTPRSLNRSSLVLKMLSPEEGVEVLMKSPMIEMERKRKTPKTPRTPGFTGRIDPLNFDELDESLDSSQSSGVSSSQDPIPETLGTISLETGKNPDEASVIQDSGISSAVTTPNTKDQKCDTTESSGPHDVPFFRNLVSATVSRLNQLSEEWDQVSKTDSRLTEELQERIRMTTGQAQLLISRKGRFTQFANLVDDCEFQRGEQKTTCADLQGFWEMVNFQVEDVYKKFEELTKLKENNWEEKKEISKVQPKKKVIKKKTAVPKTASSKPSAKSKFAAFRAKMKQQQQDKKVEENTAEPDSTQVKTFEGGFFQVNSPVKTETELRKSLVANVVRSTSRPSTPKRFSKSPSCASPLLLHVISRRSRSIGGVGISNVLNTEVANSTGSPKVNSKTQPINTNSTPVQQSSAIVSGSIFTPDSPACCSVLETYKSTPRTAGNSVRRSKRLSIRTAETPMGTAEDSPGGLMKYLMPSNTLNTDPEVMETETNYNNDVEMSANMKRGLLSEFDKACSRQSISLTASPNVRKSVLKSASERRRSNLGRSRQSVHFNLSSADLASQALPHSTAPATPFNRNSLVPRRRTPSGRRSSSSEQKENLLFTPPTTTSSFMAPVSESPATRLSKLTFDPNSPMNTIFTPPSYASKDVAPEPAVATLIDLNFSPEEAENDGAGRLTNENSKSSNKRISLL